MCCTSLILEKRSLSFCSRCGQARLLRYLSVEAGMQQRNASHDVNTDSTSQNRRGQSPAYRN